MIARRLTFTQSDGCLGDLVPLDAHGSARAAADPAGMADSRHVATRCGPQPLQPAVDHRLRLDGAPTPRSLEAPERPTGGHTRGEPVNSHPKEKGGRDVEVPGRATSATDSRKGLLLNDSQPLVRIVVARWRSGWRALILGEVAAGTASAHHDRVLAMTSTARGRHPRQEVLR